MKVCIAEKPSVAREIASVLGANTKHDGYYEGNGYVVTYTFGHLCTLKEPNDYKPHWKSWDLNNLPMLPDKFETKVVENSGIQKQFRIIKSLFDKATLVINCGDAGQEGELIQRWVMNEANYKGEVQRLWISSLTTEAIKEGFQNLKPSANYDNLYYAGFSRAIGDWLLGMNATRLYTVKHGGYKQVLSIGRVQTPTLAMVVDRWKEIENFKPQPYWELQTLYRDTLFSYEEGRFLNKEDGAILANKVKENEFEIVSVEKKNGNEFAPKLFDLTGLQVYCNTKFGFSADETLKIAQTLYEQKVITYPRVDTTFLSNDIYPKVPGILQNLTNYAALTKPLLEKKIKKSAKVFNDRKVTDHHAIIPTGVHPQALTDMERRVFDLIARRFIAVFYPDCKVATTTVLGEVDQIEFKVTGKQILDPGWRVVFAKETSEEKELEEEENVLPAFVKGESGPHVPDLYEKWTQPPRPYTEATLLRAMETAGKLVDNDELRDALKENGIGRPSTRAAIIETLFKRNYIRKERKNLIATPTGVELIQLIREELLKSAELTGLWEKKLREIEKRTYDAHLFLEELKQMVTEVVMTVLADNTNRRITIQEAVTLQEKEPKKRERKATTPKPKKEKGAASLPTSMSVAVGQVCPLCGKGTIIRGKTAYGCSEWKNGCSFRHPLD